MFHISSPVSRLPTSGNPFDMKPRGRANAILSLPEFCHSAAAPHKVHYMLDRKPMVLPRILDHRPRAAKPCFCSAFSCRSRWSVEPTAGPAAPTPMAPVDRTRCPIRWESSDELSVGETGGKEWVVCDLFFWVVTSASLVVTGALLVVTRTLVSNSFLLLPVKATCYY